MDMEKPEGTREHVERAALFKASKPQMGHSSSEPSQLLSSVPHQLRVIPAESPTHSSTPPTSSDEDIDDDEFSAALNEYKEMNFGRADTAPGRLRSPPLVQPYSIVVKSVEPSGTESTPLMSPQTPVTSEDRELYADIDKLMNGVAALERLTEEALEASPEKSSLTLASLPNGVLGAIEEAAERPLPAIDEAAERPLSLPAQVFERQPSRGSLLSTGDMTPSKGELTPGAQGKFPGRRSIYKEAYDAEVIKDFEKRINRIELEITGWGSRLEESEERVRVDLLGKMEQVVGNVEREMEQVVGKVERELQNKIFEMGLQARSPEPSSPSRKMGLTPPRTPEPSLRESPPADGQRASGKRASLPNLPRRPSTTPKQRGSTSTHHAFGTAVPSKERKPSRERASSLDYQGDFENVKKELAEELVTLKSWMMAQLSTNADQLRRDVFETEQRSLKSWVTTELATNVEQLRHQVLEVEQRMKVYIRDYTEEEAKARQNARREMDKEAKSQMPDSSVVRMSSARSGDLHDALSLADSDHMVSVNPPESKMGRPRDSDVTNQLQRVVDVQLRNVPNRCAWLVSTLSSTSHIVEAQVTKHLKQLAGDLEKVATYVSGTLQLQLESKTEIVSILERQLEQVTKVLLPPEGSGQASSGALTTSVRSVMVPGVVRWHSGEDNLKVYSPSASPSLVRSPAPSMSPPPDERSLVHGKVSYAVPIIARQNQRVRTPSPPRQRRLPADAALSAAATPPLLKSVTSVGPPQATLPSRGRSEYPSIQPPTVSSSLRDIASRSTWSPTTANRSTLALAQPSQSPTRSTLPSAHHGTILRGAHHEGTPITTPVAGGRMLRQPSHSSVPTAFASPGQVASAQTGGSTPAPSPKSQRASLTRSPTSQVRMPQSFATPLSPINAAWSASSSLNDAPLSVSSITAPVSVSTASLTVPVGASTANQERVTLAGSETSTPVSLPTSAGQAAVQGTGPSQKSMQEKADPTTNRQSRSRMSIIESRLDAIELQATLSKELSKSTQS